MKKIKTIILKEWAEVFRNRMVIFTVIFLPLMMTAIPLAILYSTRGASQVVSNSMDTGLPANVTAEICPAGVTGTNCFQVFMINQFMLMFMLIPVIIPATMAAYSIVGEKTNRSLEPLLATPITTTELLLGKCLATVIPAAMATFAAFGIFGVGARILVQDNAVLVSFFDTRWLIAIFITGPLLALMAVTFSLMVSSRVNDPRVAEQISMVIIVPVLGGFFGQVAGLFVLNKTIIVWVTILLAVIDGGLLYLATRVFQRETILTRWK
jgi:ABC-2 type transport system permease protein